MIDRAVGDTPGQMVALSPGILLVTDKNLRVIATNDQGRKLKNIDLNDKTATSLLDILDQVSSSHLRATLDTLGDNKSCDAIMTKVIGPHPNATWIEWSVRHSNGYFYFNGRDASERHRRDMVRDAERRLVAAIARGQGLEEILILACRLFEDLQPDALCSILLTDASRTRLRKGAAPSLPVAYTDALQDLEIGPEVGSCGTAVYTRSTIIVSDIASDPKWAAFKSLAASHDLAACWSVPLFDSAGVPLGTFAIYHRTAHHPPATEIEVARVFCNAVSVAIERRAAQDALIEAQLAAETASNAKSAFLAHLSHELRTPLNAVIGYSDAMLDGVFGKIMSARYLDYAKGIHSSGKLLLEMIDGLLDLARLESGHEELREELVDVRQLLTDCVRLVGTPETLSHCQVELSITARGQQLMADRQALKRIVLNLLSNAIKFSKPDSSVSVVLESNGEGLQFRVCDRGIGISETDLQKIGGAFVRLPNSRASQGSGLGLFISRSLTELHGGRLTLTSKLGVGTEAIASFPASRVSRLSGAA